MPTYSIRCSDGNTLKDLTGVDLLHLADQIECLINFKEAWTPIECESGRRVCVTNSANPLWEGSKDDVQPWLDEAAANEEEIAAFIALKSQ